MKNKRNTHIGLLLSLYCLIIKLRLGAWLGWLVEQQGLASLK